MNPIHQGQPTILEHLQVEQTSTLTGVSTDPKPVVDTLLEGDICSFENEEIETFVDMSAYFNANPRKIKRITNIYTCVRLLLPRLNDTDYDHDAKKEEDQKRFRRKLLAWIVLCEQWPVRMCWILQLLEDYEQANPRKKDTPLKAKQRKELNERSLGDLFFKQVETVVYDINGRDSLPAAMKDKYQKAYSLDSDPEVFDQFVLAENCGGIIVADIGSGMRSRRNDRLLSFTINLNPALKELIASISSYREEENQIFYNMRKKFKRLSVHSALPKLPDYDEQQQYLQQWPPGEAPGYPRFNNGFRSSFSKQKIRYAEFKSRGEKKKSQFLGFMNPKTWRAPRSSFKSMKKFKPSLAQFNSSLAPANLEHFQPSLSEAIKQEHKRVTVRTSPNLDGTQATEGPGEEEKSESKGALVDDMRGADHVGITNYALRISQLIVLKLETPSVFGIYASWGSGKSFLMNKIIAKIKAVAMSRLVHERYSRVINRLSNKKKISEYEKERDRILLDIKWVSENSETKISEIYGKRAGGKFADDFSESLPEFVWYTEILTGTLALGKFAVALAKSCFKKSSQIILNRKNIIVNFKDDEYLAKFVQDCYATNPERVSKEEHEKASEKEKDEGRGIDDTCAVDYEFVWFNAWIYSGNDNLWAGLIKSLYTTVEQHYGPEYAYAERKAALIWGGMKLVLSFVLMIVSVTVYKQEMEIDDFTSITSMRSAAEISSVFGGILATITVAQTVYSLLVSPISASKKIIKEASSAQFKMKLGYMNEIKQNLSQIGKYLDQPSSVPTFWNFLLPKSLVSAHFLRTLNQFWRGNHRRRKCRLVIFVDDLDRCPPQKCVEVLQSLVLLTEGTPFVIFLAIDPRIVVTAIEVDNKKFFGDAGINGYEYLDKIVQIPFAWPSLVSEEKAMLTRGYLTGDSSPDTISLKALASKLGVTVNKEDIQKTVGVTFSGKFVVKIEWKGKCQKFKTIPSFATLAFSKLELLDLRDNELEGNLSNLPGQTTVLLDGNPNLVGDWQCFPSHFWDFRQKQENIKQVEVKDKCSDLMAMLRGPAKLTTDGLKLAGDGGHAALTNFEWGGAFTFEVYVRLEGAARNRMVDLDYIFSFGNFQGFPNSSQSAPKDVVKLISDRKEIECIVSRANGPMYESFKAGTFDSSAWTHVVLTSSSVPPEIKIYKNGGLVHTQIVKSAPQVLTRDHHIIGGNRPGEENSFMDGTIAYFKAWHGLCLTHSHIKDLYTATNHVPNYHIHYRRSILEDHQSLKKNYFDVDIRNDALIIIAHVCIWKANAAICGGFVRDFIVNNEPCNDVDVLLHSQYVGQNAGQQVHEKLILMAAENNNKIKVSPILNKGRTKCCMVESVNNKWEPIIIDLSDYSNMQALSPPPGVDSDASNLIFTRQGFGLKVRRKNLPDIETTIKHIRRKEFVYFQNLNDSKKYGGETGASKCERRLLLYLKRGWTCLSPIPDSIMNKDVFKRFKPLIKPEAEFTQKYWQPSPAIVEIPEIRNPLSAQQQRKGGGGGVELRSLNRQPSKMELRQRRSSKEKDSEDP